MDLLIFADDRIVAMDHLESYPDRSQTIGRGETKISIRVGKAFQVDGSHARLEVELTRSEVEELSESVGTTAAPALHKRP